MVGWLVIPGLAYGDDEDPLPAWNECREACDRQFERDIAEPSRLPGVRSMDRELEYWPAGADAPLRIQVKVSVPIPDAPYWSCHLEIVGFGKPYSMQFPGVDAIDAWLSAISMVPHVLRSFTPPGGRLTWQGREDLGFATMALGTPPGT